VKKLFVWAKEMCHKYRSVILYLFFGGVTTFVNIGIYWLCFSVLGIPNAVSNALAWILAVVTAYVTNKQWVFESKSWEAGVILPEIGKFVAARIVSGLLDEGIMILGVDILGFGGLAVKIVCSVLVVVLNYIFSRFIIFRDKK